MTQVRPERPADYERLREIEGAACLTTEEAGLVEAIRNEAEPFVSHVSSVFGQAGSG